MQKDGVDASFVYNENGLRVQKTVNGVVTDYTLHGKNIVHMKTGSDELHFFYDAKGKPAVVVYNGVAYSYVKNLQGDIVAILDSTGTVVVGYTYDAWGKPLATTGAMAATLGAMNPFRYRSYCFDRESGLYYLKSRYYNATWLRFVNADMLLQPNFNLFAYCVQNPTNRVDPDGATDFSLADWEMMSNRSLLSPYNLGSIAGGFRGNTAGIRSGYGVWKESQAYEEYWTNSNYNLPDIQNHFSQNDAATLSSVEPYTESMVYDPQNVKIGWKPGENIFNYTQKGNFPSWSTIRYRFWKNEYFYNQYKYTPDNQLRIKDGLAPLDNDGRPFHLHHPNGREGDNYFVFGPVDPITHMEIHSK